MAGAIVILTGAGISADSGLSTFRDAGGIWARNRIEDVATPAAFLRDPARVHAFYNERRATAAKARPNVAHRALARLARARPGEVTLVTQNVDALHEAAGSPEVLHMHGRLDRALCPACAHRWPAPARMTTATPCPACHATSARPDVVWFGETPHHMDEILDRLAQARLFAAIGTSGEVYPAAGFAQQARRAGADCVEINLEPGCNARDFDRFIPGPAGETVPAWVAHLLG